MALSMTVGPQMRVTLSWEDAVKISPLFLFMKTTDFRVFEED
jgi:hypothetical protein